MSQTVNIQSVVKRYGDYNAVDHISIQIEKGEFFTLLGPSGCGKTTLLRMIAGFNEVEEGSIYFNEQLINHLPAHKRNIGMVFQNYAIFPHLTVAENVAYGLKARKIPAAETEQRVTEAMDLMQISEYRNRKPSQLSGGQQQRVALARAVVIRPDILLMDEPLSNLDAKLRVEMRSSIKRLQNSLGITTIYVTHDQEEALAISDRIAVMQAGKIEQIGQPREIYNRPVNRFVANFIGTSGFIEGDAEEDGIHLINKKLPIRLKDGYQGKVIVSLRPEMGTLAEISQGDLVGTLELSTFLGDFISHEIRLDDGPLVEINEYSGIADDKWKVGDRVSVKLSTNKLNIFRHDDGSALPVQAEVEGI